MMNYSFDIRLRISISHFYISVLFQENKPIYLTLMSVNIPCIIIEKKSTITFFFGVFAGFSSSLSSSSSELELSSSLLLSFCAVAFACAQKT